MGIDQPDGGQSCSGQRDGVVNVNSIDQMALAGGVINIIIVIILLAAGGRGVSEPTIQFGYIQLHRLNGVTFPVIIKTGIGDVRIIEIGGICSNTMARARSNVGYIRGHRDQGVDQILVLIKNRKIGAITRVGNNEIRRIIAVYLVGRVVGRLIGRGNGIRRQV